jgi:hypothetical protein
MLLRESSKKADQSLSFNAVTDVAAGDVGVENEASLAAIAEAVCKGDRLQLSKVRQKAQLILGAQGLVDAIGIAAAFNGITKIANGTGLPLDQSNTDTTRQLRAETGIDGYSEQAKALMFDD